MSVTQNNNENSGLLGCDAPLLGKWFLTTHTT